MKKIVFVVGAGRSGTSAITRALQVLGVDLGETLMLANSEFNKKGYFEDLEFFDFNNRLFDEIGSVWHDLSVMSPHTSINEEAYSEGHTLLTKKMHDISMFGVKDPQISRIIPFWSKIARQADVLDHYVIALRHPLSVARSLSKYANFPIQKCFEIWFIFTLQAIADSAQARRIVTSYEKVLKDPNREISRIASLVAVDFKSNSNAFRNYAEEFLDNSENHNSLDSATDDYRFSLPIKVKMLYDFALRLADDSIHIESAEARSMIEHFIEIRRNDLSLAGIVTAQEKAIRQFENDFDVANQTIQNLILDRDSHKVANECSCGIITSLQKTIADLIVDRDAYQKAYISEKTRWKRKWF